jgi:hypothetical protein
MSKVSNQRLGILLAKRGLLPQGCRLIEIHIEPSGALAIRYERYIEDEELRIFADVFREVAEEIAADDHQNAAARERGARNDDGRFDANDRMDD